MKSKGFGPFVPNARAFPFGHPFMKDMKMGKNKGFTLIEGMIVVVILSIMASMGGIMWQNYIRKTKINTFVNQYINSMRIARINALKDITPVMICPSEDGEKCAGKVEAFGSHDGGKLGGILVYGYKTFSTAKDAGDDNNKTENTIFYSFSETAKNLRIVPAKADDKGEFIFGKTGNPTTTSQPIRFKIEYVNDPTSTAAEALKTEWVCVNRLGAIVNQPKECTVD